MYPDRMRYSGETKMQPDFVAKVRAGTICPQNDKAREFLRNHASLSAAEELKTSGVIKFTRKWFVRCVGYLKDAKFVVVNGKGGILSSTH